MAHGVSEVLGEGGSVAKMLPGKQSQQQQSQQQQRQQGPHQRSVMGSRRIFPPAFKVKVLDSYRNDEDCKLNQRATARKFNIHRRQIQKWLQNEKTLRDSCPDGSSGASSSASSSGVTTPAASPPQDQTLLQQSHYHHQQQQQQQQPIEPTPASPALNLSLARLHGDELASQPPQQQQPPPPPPAQQSSAAQALAAAAAVAATHQQQQPQPQQPDYRFQVSPTAAIALAAAAATGYPDFKADHPIRQPVPHNFAAAVHRPPISYSALDLYAPLVYQPTGAQQQPPLHPYEAAAALDHQMHQSSRFNQQQQQQQHQHFPASFESSSSSSTSPSLHSEDELQQQQQRRASLIRSTDIKIERASPDYPATPSPCEASPLFAKAALKREHPDEEDQCTAYHRASSLSLSLSSSSSSCSPAPSQPDHLESLPLSPDRSSASSDSEMEQNPGGAGADLARRRSFSLRFKLEVLDAFHRDREVAGNQRATARKFDINRRQVQKWLLQESELRGVIELCGSDSRQRLGPVQESDDSAAVDLSKSLASPSSQPYLGCDYPIDSSLTPPYSTPGCSLSCCQESTPQPQPYYCYSPGDLDSLKRPVCTQSCCLPAAAKKLCTEESRAAAAAAAPKETPEPEPEQESPLCLVKPKRDSPVPSSSSSPPASKKDAILFKPYLDNPVSKPSSDESANNNNNNNCQNACNLNERPGNNNLELELSFKLPANYRAQQQHPTYLDVPPVRSAFVRYPSTVHYS